MMITEKNKENSFPQIYKVICHIDSVKMMGNASGPTERVAKNKAAEKLYKKLTKKFGFDARLISDFLTRMNQPWDARIHSLDKQ